MNNISPPSSQGRPVYAVHTGPDSGYYRTWEEAKEKLRGVSNARYKKCRNVTDAMEWLDRQLDVDASMSLDDGATPTPVASRPLPVLNDHDVEQDSVTITPISRPTWATPRPSTPPPPSSPATHPGASPIAKRTKSPTITPERVRFVPRQVASPPATPTRNPPPPKTSLSSPSPLPSLSGNTGKHTILPEQQRQQQQQQQQQQQRSGSVPQASRVVIYTDGAAPDNQNRTTRTAGYGVHWAVGRPEDIQDISARCPQSKRFEATNNYAELYAIIRALEIMGTDPRPLSIRSDSAYSVGCFQWVEDWRRRGWRTSKGDRPKNLELIRYMSALRSLRREQGLEVEIMHVRGHANGSGPDALGNARADQLATAGAVKPCEEEEPDWDELIEIVERQTAAVMEKKRGPADDTPAQTVGVTVRTAVADPPGSQRAAAAAIPTPPPSQAKPKPTRKGWPVVRIVDDEDIDLSMFEASDYLDDAELVAELKEAWSTEP